ncbi:MAG: trigger factor [Firmicutes bacterium]|nr:trigger factor [Bacillota bacterium]MBR6237032.1 trigger factor [Bacillota bacterium]
MTTSYVGKENNKVKFTMEFTAEEFEAAIQKVYLRNRGRIQVDGFRRGKAPRKIIEAKYGSGIFFEEAIDDLLKDNYPKALDEFDIDPIDRPSIDFEGEEKIEQGKGFKVVVETEVAPEVDPKDYKGVKAERELQKLDETEVEAQLKAFQKRNARMLTIDEPANWDDTVVLDYKGFVGEDQFQGGTADDQQLVLGSNTFIPGFEAQLVGAKAGDEKDVVVTFPEEYHAADLAGKEAVFKCTIKEVRREELPVLDDDFAKEASSFDTLEEFKADIRKSIETRIERSNENAGKEAVMEKICELNPVDIPAVMVDDEADKMFDEFRQQLMSQGIDINMYCKYLNTTPEEIRKGYNEDAKKRVHGRLVLAAIAAKEGMEATEEDIDKELEQLASAYNMEKDKILQTMGEGYKKLLAQDIKNGKALDFVYANAKLSEPKKTAKKAEKAEGETKPAAKKTTKKAEKAEGEEKPAAKKTTKKTTKKAEAEKPEASENTEA